MLPIDIINNVYKFCDIKSLCTLKITCKFNNQNIKFTEKQEIIKYIYTNSSNMFSKNVNSKLSFGFEDTNFINNIPQLHFYQIEYNLKPSLEEVEFIIFKNLKLRFFEKDYRCSIHFESNLNYERYMITIKNNMYNITNFKDLWT